MHHAFGPGLGAAGVHQAQQLIVVDLEVRRGSRGGQPEREVVPPCGARCSSVVNTTFVVTVPPRVIACAAVGMRSCFDDDTADPAVAEDVGDLLGGEHEVDRHEHDRGASGGECQHGVLPAVARQQRDPVAGGKTVVPQRRRGTVHQVVEFGERQRDIAVDDRDLVGVSACRPAGDVAQ